MAEAAFTGRDTVLVVDDAPDSLGFLTEMLDDAGYTVLIATDGESALHLVSQITPDLVLLDALMPGVNGFDTCRQLKQNPELLHLPVVFMTGLSETEHVVSGFAAGGVDYVTKPIVVKELLARIRVHLANARNARGQRAALDAAGRYLFAVDANGQIKWCTPKAREMLSAVCPPQQDQELALPAHVISNLLAVRRSGATREASCMLSGNSRRVECTMLSPIGADELLFRLSEEVPAAGVERLRSALGLTLREADVLLWLSRGKTNREIGEILTISPRTVNKHLEQVFTKLGVENRASAAARAVRLLAE
ncbi:MAG TPA: response regulator transcription factor [Steroidobacteraceae bacterium]|nr:response regulator transcription factor [Steroidobacteraceae bacterium]